MNRQEFETLRNLPDKTVGADIEFKSVSGAGPNLIFDGIPVENSLGLDVRLNGTFKPDVPAVTYNFVLKGVGPICRICVNGTSHGAAGRTHKHDLQTEEDPRKNLPVAVARPDLEDKSAQQIWMLLCEQARIEHTGTFVAPEGS